MSPPLVSVVIAAWNAAEYLPQTLASALAQTWPNLEVILVDDESTDATAAAIAPFLPRLRYERRGHGGLAAARNEGIRLARGDYIALLDADDLWHPRKIAAQVELALRQPQSGLIACNGEEFQGGQVLRKGLFGRDFTAAVLGSPAGEATGRFQRELIRGNQISCPAQVLLPRPVVERIGAFVDSGAQDYDYYLRVSAHYPITLQRESLARWRFRPDSMSGPRADRPLRWALDGLPVLVAHRQRCHPEDRSLLEQRIRKQAWWLRFRRLTQGREIRRHPAGALLPRLLQEHPWPPGPLVYLADHWLPALLQRILARMTRSLRRSSRS